MIRSLRARLLLGTLAATACLFAAAAVVLYWSIHRALLAEFDATLAARGDALVALVEQGPGGIKTDIDPLALPEYRLGKHPDFFVLGTSSGAVLARSESFAGRSSGSLGAPAGETPEFAFVTLPNGRPGRRMARAFAPHAEDGGDGIPPHGSADAYVVVARDARELEEKNARLAGLLAVVFFLATLASGAILWWRVGRGLAPLDRLAEEIRALGSHALSKRVGTREVPAELEPVAARLNGLLEELEAAFARERTFAADVAHELRTPLAGMIMTLQVCATRRRAPEEYEAALGTCLELADGMRAMSEKLLLLARMESGRQAPSLAPVDLRRMAEELWQGYGPKAQARHLRVEWACPTPLPAQTDAALFAVVLRNLLDNALAHAPDGGWVRITGQAAEGQVVLRVANSGSQVRAEEIDRIFDRFWRADQAREAHGRHFGLGLALCRRIMALLGGSIRAETAFGESFAVEVRLPCRSAGQAGGVDLR